MAASDVQYEQNLASLNVGVRWQAQMEDAIGIARERLMVVSRLSVTETDVIMAHAAVAQAAATTALVLAVANVGSDVESALARLAERGES